MIKKLKYKLNKEIYTTDSYNWIVNGEHLTGVDYNKNSNIGSYNRVSKQLAENIEIIYELAELLQIESTDQADAIENIEQSLKLDSSIINKVNNNTNRIEYLENLSPDNLSDDIESIKNIIGSRHINDNTLKNIMDDLYYIKTQIGSDARFDINGNGDNSLGTGIKYKIDLLMINQSTNNTAINTLDRAISSILLELINLSENKISKSSIVHSLGNSRTEVMSQNSITLELSKKRISDYEDNMITNKDDGIYVQPAKWTKKEW